jgi:RNA polymerase sigma factor (sigma-70 family)
MSDTIAAGRMRLLLAEHYRLLWYFANRAAARAHGLDPGDALGEICVMALRYAGRYNPDRGPFAGWVALIARSVAGRHRGYCGRDCRDDRRTIRGLDLAQFALDHPPEPADAEVRKLAARVRRALAELSEQERSWLARRFGLDGSPECTLGQLDPAVSREANRQRVEAALGKLRRLLADGDPDRAVVEALRQAGGPVRFYDLARRSGLSYGQTRRTLVRLAAAGKVKRTGSGIALAA